MSTEFGITDVGLWPEKIDSLSGSVIDFATSLSDDTIIGIHFSNPNNFVVDEKNVIGIAADQVASVETGAVGDCNASQARVGSLRRRDGRAQCQHSCVNQRLQGQFHGGPVGNAAARGSLGAT